MSSKIYDNYFFDEHAYDYHDDSYVPLEESSAPQQKLRIPGVLKPDKDTPTDTYYTIDAQVGETQFLPGAKTKTWGYNDSFLGKTIILKRGKTYHMHLKNDLPELTTYHWHGLDVPGPIEDGGCHAIVYPGEARDVQFKINQPAATTWLHAHSCPETAYQVWQGLAAAVVVQDDVESKLPFPRNYGVDDIPVILQDRRFHENNQFDYRADYNPDGVMGPTVLINGTVNPYFDVTTQRVRLRILDGCNRREWRLHFSDDLPFTQIASDGGILPEPIVFTHLMTTCGERHEVIVDFGKYKEGDEVILYSDKTPILRFRIHHFEKDDTKLPEHLVDIPEMKVDDDMELHDVTLDGMDEFVAMDGKKFDMQRIDYKMPIHKTQLWRVTNTNKKKGGMIHPYHMHGLSFQVVSRNDHEPYPNELGRKDTISINPEEHVIIKVRFENAGVFMYHCHIIEHEDGGMMAQLQAYDPAEPDKKYELMKHETVVKAFAKERGISEDKLWLGGMDSYSRASVKM